MSQIKLNNLNKQKIEKTIETLKEEKKYRCLDNLNPNQIKYLAYVTLKIAKAVTNIKEDKDLSIKQKDFYKHIIDIAECNIEPSKYKPYKKKSNNNYAV